MTKNADTTSGDPTLLSTISLREGARVHDELGRRGGGGGGTHVPNASSMAATIKCRRPAVRFLTASFAGEKAWSPVQNPLWDRGDDWNEKFGKLFIRLKFHWRLILKPRG